MSSRTSRVTETGGEYVNKARAKGGRANEINGNDERGTYV